MIGILRSHFGWKHGNQCMFWDTRKSTFPVVKVFGVKGRNNVSYNSSVVEIFILTFLVTSMEDKLRYANWLNTEFNNLLPDELYENAPYQRDLFKTDALKNYLSN